MEAPAGCSHVLQRLPILLLHVHSRCNCRCVMCDIWKRSDQTILTREALEAQRESFLQLRVEHVVFTGGEPLMHHDLTSLISFFRELDVRLTLLTSGLLLQRHARVIAEGFDEVIVSVDGPPGVHDRIRGIPGAFASIHHGIQALRTLVPQLPIRARCTIQRANLSSLCAATDAVCSAGMQSISFLAADLDSTAFNRELVWPIERRNHVALSAHEINALEAELDQLEQLRAQLPPGFTIVESRRKLQRIADHFRAAAGLAAHRAPVCNAPWVSAVWETDGSIKPCFFQPALGNLNQAPLQEVLNGPSAVAFRTDLDMDRNDLCRRCVCSLNYKQ